MKSVEQKSKLLNPAYSQFLETIPESAIVVNRIGNIVMANSSAGVMFGYKPEALQGQPFQVLMSKTKRQIHLDLMESFFTGRKAKPIGQGWELAAQHMDGSEFSIDIRLKPFEMRGDLVTLCIVRDITQRINMEKALRKSGRIARTALNELSPLIAILDETGTIVTVNNTWRSFGHANGGSPEKIAEGVNYLRVCESAHGMYAEGAAEVADGIRAVISGKKAVFMFEHQCHSPIEQRWFLTRVTRFEEKGSVRVVVSHSNTTRHRQAEKAFREIEERFCMASEDSPVMIFNQDHEQHFDWKQVSLPGTSAVINSLDENPPQVEDTARLARIKKKVLSSGIPIREAVRSTADGRAFFFDLTVEPINEKHTKIACCNPMDNALLVSENRFKSVVLAMAEGMILQEASGAITDANSSAERILGLTVDQLLGNTSIDPGGRAIHEDGSDFPSETHPAMVTLRTGQPQSNVIMGIHQPDGVLRWISINSVSLRQDGASNPVAAVTTFYDITETKFQQHKQEVVAIINLALSVARLRSKVLSIILDKLVVLMKNDGAAFVMRDPASGETVIELAVGAFSAGTGMQTVPGEDVSCHVIQTGQPYISNDVHNDPRFSQSVLLTKISAVAFLPLINQTKTIGALCIGRTEAFSEHDVHLLIAIADMAADAIQRMTLRDQTKRDAIDLALAYDTTIEGWSHALDMRDKETEGHSSRVTEVTIRMARMAGMSADELVHVRRGALLHDIGKMGIPDSILLKPDKLTNNELGIMHMHPVYAHSLLSPIAYLRSALEIPYYHHEKWDGSGYPTGLKGNSIPLAARLFAVVDVWDALRSDRPYRKGWPERKVLEHIKNESGTHFDPKAVELFFEVLNEDTQIISTKKYFKEVIS